MRVLLIKMSSLGDVVHALPALTDAWHALPGLQVDWVVEEGLAEVPSWHPAVARVIPIALRRWRKNWLGTRMERRLFRTAVKERRYDIVLDAQGLFKSAWVGRMAHGQRRGLSPRSARDSLATLSYHQRIPVSWEHHAVERMRQLFATALAYPKPSADIDYGLDLKRLPSPAKHGDIVFLHGTTWPHKHWPEQYWQTLARHAEDAGWRVLIPWGTDEEHERARRIADSAPRTVEVLPRLDLAQLAGVIASARVAVGVDTGLAHLAAALAVPTLTLYGPTRPDRTGTFGANQRHLAAEFSCAPCMQRRCTYRGPAEVQPACFASLPPDRVWSELRDLMAQTKES